MALITLNSETTLRVEIFSIELCKYAVAFAHVERGSAQNEKHRFLHDLALRRLYESLTLIESAMLVQLITWLRVSDYRNVGNTE